MRTNKVSILTFDSHKIGRIDRFYNAEIKTIFKNCERRMQSQKCLVVMIIIT
jgi:hypothetical protein